MVLSIIMVAVIHPIVTLALGILTKTIGTLVFKKCTPDGHFSRCANYLLTVIGRLSTYSINVHLTFLAGIVLYAFNWWYSLEVRDVDYANEAFNQCICKPTEEKKGLQCPKPEFITNFQNDVNSVPLHTLLLTFVILSIAFHIIQSVITFFPPPLRLFDFIFGPVQEGSKSHDKEKYLKWFKIVFCFLGLTYVIGLFCVPLTFHLLSEDIDEVENGKALIKSIIFRYFELIILSYSKVLTIVQQHLKIGLVYFLLFMTMSLTLGAQMYLIHSRHLDFGATLIYRMQEVSVDLRVFRYVIIHVLEVSKNLFVQN